jgi:dCTP deaminase
MAFWSGEKLLQNSHVIVPFSNQQIDCNAYTMRMGNCYYRTAEQETGHEQKKTFLSNGESFLIPAGQFAYLLSKERVEIPYNTIAFISMRTGIKFQGLINVSGFHVDPGYKGKLIYAVYNASPSPVQICEGDPIFKIWFCELDRTSAHPYVFKGEGFDDIGNDLIKGMSKEILSLQSLADKLRSQQNEINAKFAEQKPAIEQLTHIWRTVVLGVVGALIISIFGLFVTFSIPSVYALGQKFLNYWSNKIQNPESATPASTPPLTAAPTPTPTSPVPPRLVD